MKVSQSILVVMVLLLVLVAGCKSHDLKQESVPLDVQISTAEHPYSYEPQVADRGWDERVLYYQNIAAEHKTLYLKGPYEQTGSNDGYFSLWDKDSAYSVAWSPVVAVGKTLVLPISMFLTPPWKHHYNRSDFPLVEPTFYMPAEVAGMAANEVKR